MGRKALALIMALSLMCACVGCKGRSIGSVSGTGFYFDTIVTFTVYGTENQKVIDELMMECSRYEKMFSTTDDESELYKLNHGEIEWVSGELYECVERCLEYCAILDGRYDVSIRPVSELWDFGEGKGEVPAALDIENALEKVDYTNIKLLGPYDGDDSDLYGKYRILLEKGAMIELGSAAKGYIADALARYLENRRYESAIISLGGNVQCLKGKLVGDGEYEDFKVAVKSPFGGADGESGYSNILFVRDKAVVTSGIYERCFEKDGVLYHHILDSKTGYPVESDLASVTILSESGFDADVLSTVCFLAGYGDTVDRYDELCKYGPFDAEFIYKDGSRLIIGNGFD